MRKNRNRKASQIEAFKRFGDGIRNPLMRLGAYDANTFSATHYGYQFSTLNRQQLEAAYQSSWICAMAVDVIAEDMTREGIDIKAEDPAVIDALNVSFDDLGIWRSVSDTIKWSRLYGGAIAVMLIDGQDAAEPLTEVPKGRFRGLYVLDRWQVQPSSELVQELGADFGQPEYYQLLDESGIAFPRGRVHHSRVIRMDGRKMPHYMAATYQGWGASVLEAVIPQIKAFDLATQSAAQLLSKSYLRFYQVEGLRDILTNGAARDGFLKQMDYMREFQSIEGLTIGDTSDNFQTMQYTFTGIPDILIQFGQQISGAIGVPLVRLFGQSPAGLNSTGESDLRIYYDNVRHAQDTSLRQGLKRLLRVMYESLTGSTPGSDFSFEFKPLWQMTNEQKAAVAQGLSGSILSALQAGAITLPIAMRELKKLSDTVGVFGSITDEDIKAAEETENALMPPEANLTEDPANVGEDVSGVNEDGPHNGVVHEAPESNREAGAEDSQAVRLGNGS